MLAIQLSVLLSGEGFLGSQRHCIDQTRVHSSRFGPPSFNITGEATLQRAAPPPAVGFPARCVDCRGGSPTQPPPIRSQGRPRDGCICAEPPREKGVGTWPRPEWNPRKGWAGKVAGCVNERSSRAGPRTPPAPLWGRALSIRGGAARS